MASYENMGRGLERCPYYGGVLILNGVVLYIQASIVLGAKGLHKSYLISVSLLLLLYTYK